MFSRGVVSPAKTKRSRPLTPDSYTLYLRGGQLCVWESTAQTLSAVIKLDAAVSGTSASRPELHHPRRLSLDYAGTDRQPPIRRLSASMRYGSCGHAIQAPSRNRSRMLCTPPPTPTKQTQNKSEIKKKSISDTSNSHHLGCKPYVFVPHRRGCLTNFPSPHPLDSRILKLSYQPKLKCRPRHYRLWVSTVDYFI